MLTPLDATQKLIIESLQILRDIADKKSCKIDDLSDTDIDTYFEEYRQRFECDN